MTKKNIPLRTAAITVPFILQTKTKQKLSAVTAYDYTQATMVDAAGIDIVLVGDSLGGVIQGEENTLPVTLEQMVYHTRCVTRGVEHALVVADLPFMSYQVSIAQAIESSFRLIKEGGAAAVKLEGGQALAETVKRIAELDVPVMGHIGLTPQSIHRMGGFRVQGKDNPQQVINDAIAIDQAGAFAIVVEGVPDDVAAEITKKVSVPVIGIGAGAYCDGQILVLHDLLGMHNRRIPKFVKQYARIFDDGVSALEEFVKEVKSGTFPSPRFSYGDRLNG